MTYDRTFAHIIFIVKTASNKETCIKAQQQGQIVNCMHSGYNRRNSGSECIWVTHFKQTFDLDRARSNGPNIQIPKLQPMQAWAYFHVTFKEDWTKSLLSYKSKIIDLLKMWQSSNIQELL